MLRRLLVKSFLLVEQGELLFGPGLNVLTGETGAGKSILLSALGLLLGERGATSWIRGDAEALSVEGTFVPDSRLIARVRALGIPVAGNELSVVREIRRSGANRCYVNGQRVLVAVLRRLGAHLVEIHGQRAEEHFRRGEVQRDLLDLFGGHETLRRDVRAAHRALAEAEESLAAHDARLVQLRRDEEWLRFQLGETEALHPAADEIEILHERVVALRSAAARVEFAELAEEMLNAREGAVLASLEELDHRADACSTWDASWEAWRSDLHELTLQARRVYRELRTLRGTQAAEENELPLLEKRLGDLEQLQRKHRKSLAEILAAAEQMRGSLRELEEGERAGPRLLERQTAAREALRQTAEQLSAARGTAAKRLTAALHRELDAIRMPECRARVVFKPLHVGGEDAARHRGDDGEIGVAGAEQVILTVQTNTGQEYRPLGEIASGGELSRIALALRVILGQRGPAVLTVFDEIDAGLGGAAARAVADRLAAVAQHRQVLLVTHLPIIAVRAPRHLAVSKRVEGKHTVVHVTPLEGEQRVAEVARMLAGEPHDPQARRHAEALLRETLPLSQRGESVSN